MMGRLDDALDGKGRLQSYMLNPQFATATGKRPEELRAYDPSIGEKLSWILQEGLTALGLNKYDARHLAEFGSSAASMTPAVGIPMMMEGVSRDIQGGDYGGAALEVGMAAIPFPGAKGLRLKAFHGSPNAELDMILANPPARQFDNGTSALGGFFAPAPSGAQRYAGKQGRVYEADLDLKNPYEMPVSEFLRLQDPTTSAQGAKISGEMWGARLEELKREGAELRKRLTEVRHDGVVIRDSNGNIIEVASFNDVKPAQ